MPLWLPSEVALDLGQVELVTVSKKRPKSKSPIIIFRFLSDI